MASQTHQHCPQVRLLLHLDLLNDSAATSVHQGRTRGGSPADSRCAGTLTVGAHRPWNICLFRESFLFAFNRAVNCLSPLWSGDHRRSDGGLVAPSPLAAGRNRIQEVEVDVALRWLWGLLSGFRALIWNRSPLRQLYLTPTCTVSPAVSGEQRFMERRGWAQPAGWSRLFTDLACLSGMRGRAGWLIGRGEEQRSLWRHQFLQRTHLPRTPDSREGGKTVDLPGFDIDKTRVWQHVNTNSASVSVCSRYISLRLHSDYLQILWGDCVPGLLAPTSWEKKKRKRGRWYRPGWCSLTSETHSDTVGAERDRLWFFFKKTNCITPWHPVLTLCLSASNLRRSNPWKQTNAGEKKSSGGSDCNAPAPHPHHRPSLQHFPLCGLF